MKAIRRIMFGLVAAAAVALSLVSFGSGSAGAITLPHGKRVVVSDGHVVASCTLAINSYQASTGQFKGTLTLNVHSATLSQTLNTVTSYGFCSGFGDGLYGQGFDSISKVANGAGFTQSKAVLLDYDTSYAVCVDGQQVRRTGTTFDTGFDCTF
jgi:hypothetical protein